MMREGIDFCQNLGVRMLQVAGYDAFMNRAAMRQLPGTGKIS